jgi:hypothetical protein
MRAAQMRAMPHHAHDELQTISDADLVTTTGGFDIMGMMNGVMGMAGQAVQASGDPKAQQGFAQAQGIMGKVMPMIGQFAGMFGGGGGAG